MALSLVTLLRTDENARRAPAFENATHTYLNLQERFWDGGKWRFLNVTAALSGTRVAAPEPMLGTTFLSTETASSRKALPYETCAAVEIRPALLGMFTPAMVAGSFMQMTGASAGDLARAHWRRDRTPEYQGHLPKSEGCYLAMRTQAIRMPAGHQLIWHWEIDGQYAGVVTRR